MKFNLTKFSCQRLKQEELEAKAREREENMTPEEKLAEKLRLQKIQEESDLRAAMDTFGITADKCGFDGINPTTRAELSELSDAISKKVNLYTKIEDFPGFLEELVRSVCVNCKYFVVTQTFVAKIMEIKFQFIFFSEF